MAKIGYMYQGEAMFRIVPYPGHPDWERLKGIEPFAVDPNAEFEPGMIEQLAVVGNKIVREETGEEIEPEKEPEESDV